jgi:GNAT superfamily N-acetyltransferase
VTAGEYAVRLLPIGGDLSPIMRMRRDWVASSTLGRIPPVGAAQMDRDPTYPERFRRWWEREADSRRTWLVWRDGEPVGMLNVKVFDRAPTPGGQATQWVYVANLWVDPPHRGRGVGTMLLRHVVDWAHQEGMARLVLSPSIVSLPMHQAMGFQTADELLRPDQDIDD